MTPKAFGIYAMAKAKDRRTSKEFIDRVFATQTANLLNAQYGTQDVPTPAKPEQCMAFNWASTEENTIEENPPMESTLEEIRTKMKGWVAATGGENV